MEIRVHEHFADYLACFARQRSVARQHYQAARQSAVERKLLEDNARLQLRIIKIDLESDQDPRLSSFQNFKKAAAELHCTAQEQLAAWMLYWGDSEEKKRGLIATRKASLASVEYFRGLLTSVKK